MLKTFCSCTVIECHDLTGSNSVLSHMVIERDPWLGRELRGSQKASSEVMQSTNSVESVNKQCTAPQSGVRLEFEHNVVFPFPTVSQNSPSNLIRFDRIFPEMRLR